MRLQKAPHAHNSLVSWHFALVSHVIVDLILAVCAFVFLHYEPLTRTLTDLLNYSAIMLFVLIDANRLYAWMSNFCVRDKDHNERIGFTLIFHLRDIRYKSTSSASASAKIILICFMMRFWIVLLLRLCGSRSRCWTSRSAPIW